VGIGVPILLFYVYGVVPVSLCRSGGCGVSTSGTGVRFEFDDENELMGTLGARNGGGKYTMCVITHSVCTRLIQLYTYHIIHLYVCIYSRLDICYDMLSSVIINASRYRCGINRRCQSPWR